MTDTTYNGWTNYSTWRVNLEIFDGFDLAEWDWITVYEEPRITEIADSLKSYVEEIIDEDCDQSRLAHSYAMAFLSDVNWYEIATHLVDAWKEEYAQEEIEE
jgi:hypothetical protein